MVRKLPSGRWQERYRDRAGRRYTRTFDTAAAARAWKAEKETEVRRGEHIDPTAGKVLLRDWSARWFDARVVEETTRRANRSRIDTHVIPAFGARPLGKVTRLEVQSWIRKLERDGLAPATIRACYHLLSQMLDDARREGLLRVNPADDVTLPTVPPGREVYLTREEVDQVVAAAREPYATVFLLLAYTGLRWGELAGLRVRQLDIAGGRLRVDGTMTRHGPKLYPKGKQRRTVPLSPRVGAALELHLTRRPAARGDLVFATRTGGPLFDGNVRKRAWLPALEAAHALEVEHERPSALLDKAPTLHDLRHTFASWLVQAGVPIARVQLLLGHQSVTTTMRYAHLAPDSDDGVLAALGGPLADVSDGVSGVHNVSTLRPRMVGQIRK